MHPELVTNVKRRWRIHGMLSNGVWRPHSSAHTPSSGGKDRGGAGYHLVKGPELGTAVGVGRNTTWVSLQHTGLAACLRGGHVSGGRGLIGCHRHRILWQGDTTAGSTPRAMRFFAVAARTHLAEIVCVRRNPGTARGPSASVCTCPAWMRRHMHFPPFGMDGRRR